jgi:hypothetical protein
MPRLIGLLCAFVALSAGILSQVELTTALLRAAIGFLAGSLLTQVWYVFFAARISHPHENSEIEEEAA